MTLRQLEASDGWQTCERYDGPGMGSGKLVAWKSLQQRKKAEVAGRRRHRSGERSDLF